MPVKPNENGDYCAWAIMHDNGKLCFVGYGESKEKMKPYKRLVDDLNQEESEIIRVRITIEEPTNEGAIPK